MNNISITKKKIFTAVGLIFSTLIFPWSFIFFFLIIPPIYTGFIVPFLIWKLIFNGQFKDIAKISLIWKIPIIIIFNLILTIGELATFPIIAYLPNSTILHVFIIALQMVILRAIAYSAIIFVWHPKTFINYPKIRLAISSIIFISIVFTSYFVYQMSITPDSPFDSYYMYCLEHGNCQIPLDNIK